MKESVRRVNLEIEWIKPYRPEPEEVAEFYDI